MNYRHNALSIPLFPLGQVQITPSAYSRLEKYQKDIATLLDRHTQGDWGTLTPEATTRNIQALHNGTRIQSNYLLARGIWINIITEAHRTHTTVLVPDE